MANMIIEVYDAFRSIGIDDENARQAAGALSDNPRAIMELRGEMKDGFAMLRSEQLVIRALLAVLTSLVLLALGGEFAIWSKLGEISAHLPQLH